MRDTKDISKTKARTSIAVLVIDDEQKLAALISRILELEGFRVYVAHTAKEGLHLLTLEDVQVVVSDVKLPDANGVELVKAIKEKKPYVEVISLTAYGTIADGVQAIKNGGFNYITKGDDNDRLLPLVYQAAEKALRQQNNLNFERGKGKKLRFEGIIGQSDAIQSAIALARKVAATDTTVLLTGETGTGKEVFAGCIHEAGDRRLQNFVAINCSGFTSALLESELFGYKAGAFTGAAKDKKGLFEEAHKGTLFLDEIGEMGLELQARLLRVLEDGSFIKVGDTQTTKVDVRIIAATNRDLEKEVETGQFRADLFYRLSVFTIKLPALNQRQADIEAIAGHYLKEFAAKTGKTITGMTDQFLQMLKQHAWKGNVRELKNVMERVVILSDNEIMSADLLPAGFGNSSDSETSMDMGAMEKQHISKVLAYTKGNKTEAARLLNIGLTTLYRKLEQYQLS